MSKNTGMQSAFDAADTIERGAEMYRGFMSAAVVLREYGTMENAIAERQKLLAQCTIETDAAQADLSLVLAGVEKAKHEAIAIAITAQGISDKLTEDTSEACATEIFNANTRAGEIVAKAEVDAQAKTDKLNVGIALLEAKKAALAADVAAMDQRAVNATTDAQDAEARLATVRAAIASLSR